MKGFLLSNLPQKSLNTARAPCCKHLQVRSRHSSRMSCTSCCVSPRELLLEEDRKKKEQEEEQEKRRNTDISALREDYRNSRERQRSRAQVLLFRKVSDELSDAVSIVPVTQTSWCEPDGSPSTALTSDHDLTTCDPWLAHLHLHEQRFHRGSSSDEDNLSSNSGSRGDLDETNPVPGIDCGSPDAPEQDPSLASNTNPPETFITCFSSVPSVCRGSGRPRLTRQLSFGGLGSSAEDQQHQNYNPFPSRKTWRISEAARRLGMYSSL